MSPPPRKIRAVGMFVCCFAMIFIAVGIWQAHEQAAMLKTYHPVAATILSRDIESRSSDDGQTYTPVARYRYLMNGHAYECTQVMAISISSGHAWAVSRLNQLPAGDKVTAYYDPANPASAFLLREVSFFPYIFVLFPMIFFSVGLGILLSDVPDQIEGLRPIAGMTLAWNAVGVIAAAHYFSAGGVLDLSAKIGLGLYGLIGVLTAYFAIRIWLDPSLGGRAATPVDSR